MFIKSFYFDSIKTDNQKFMRAEPAARDLGQPLIMMVHKATPPSSPPEQVAEALSNKECTISPMASLLFFLICKMGIQCIGPLKPPQCPSQHHYWPSWWAEITQIFFQKSAHTSCIDASTMCEPPNLDEVVCLFVKQYRSWIASYILSYHIGVLKISEV